MTGVTEENQSPRQAWWCSWRVKLFPNSVCLSTLKPCRHCSWSPEEPKLTWFCSTSPPHRACNVETLSPASSPRIQTRLQNAIPPCSQRQPHRWSVFAFPSPPLGPSLPTASLGPCPCSQQPMFVFLTSLCISSKDASSPCSTRHIFSPSYMPRQLQIYHF